MGLLLSRELPGAVSWVGYELAVDGVQGGPSGRCQCAAVPGLEGQMGRANLLKSISQRDQGRQEIKLWL